MKKIICMTIILFALMALPMSAFADNGKKIDSSNNEEFVVLSDEEDPDDLLQVCPKCGRIHDGCCEEEVFFKYVEEDDDDLKFCDIKDNMLYFVTPENKLFVMNLETKKIYFIANEVVGLYRSGMNGRNIAYITLQGEKISVPDEVGKSRKLSNDFLNKFYW